MQFKLNEIRRTLFQISALLVGAVFLVWGASRSAATPSLLLSLGKLAMVACVVAAPLLGLRACAQWLCGGRWKLRYVRLTVDVALAGLTALVIGAVVPQKYFGHVPGLMQEQIGGKYFAVQGWDNQALTDSVGRLEALSNLTWFLENFPVYVILPGVLVFFVGYRFERPKAAKKLVAGSTRGQT